MSSEVDSVDCNELDRGFGEFFEPISRSNLGFHEIIFSQRNENWRFIKNAFAQPTPSGLVQKTQKVARDQGMEIAPMKQGGSGEVGGTVAWGGKNGVEFSGYAKGEVYDDKGNSAQLKIEQNSDGTGSMTTSAKYGKNSDKK